MTLQPFDTTATLTMDSSSNADMGAQEAALIQGQRQVKHKRRYCRYQGCTRIVKSQGLCQRHGAKPRKCRVSDCVKQAQGNFDGMCKSHFKAFKRETTPLPPHQMLEVGAGCQVIQSIPEGESVYDRILPLSVAWHYSMGVPMPLIEHLAAGFNANKPPAWHRNEERKARGLVPVHNPAQQLEGWERELVWMEILALSGNADASFRHLARAWGRDKGFHMVLAQFICERRGDVERKKRERQTGSTELSNVWDTDASCFGDAYSEALAADLLTFSQQQHQQQGPLFDHSVSPLRSSQSLPRHHQQQMVNGYRDVDVQQPEDAFNPEDASYTSSAMNNSDDDEPLVAVPSGTVMNSHFPPPPGNGGPNGGAFGHFAV